MVDVKIELVVAVVVALLVVLIVGRGPPRSRSRCVVVVGIESFVMIVVYDRRNLSVEVCANCRCCCDFTSIGTCSAVTGDGCVRSNGCGSHRIRFPQILLPCRTVPTTILLFITTTD